MTGARRTAAYRHGSDVNWNPNDKERTALHEAGHAVVAWSFGVTVGSIQLDFENESGHADIASTAHLKHLEQIATWLAGFEAEQAFNPPGRKAKAMLDFGEVSRVLRENGTPENEPAGQALRERGRACAEERLRVREAKVRLVAQHLAAHRCMDRTVFEALMRGP